MANVQLSSYKTIFIKFNQLTLINIKLYIKYFTDLSAIDLINNVIKESGSFILMFLPAKLNIIQASVEFDVNVWDSIILNVLWLYKFQNL